jgi:amino acid adenylation domain-containing protein
MDPSGIHRLFEARVQRTPEAVAVVDGKRAISYQELNGWANALAYKLIKQGARPDRLVGLVADRSVEMIVGILGILKAGAAYLPLDPTYPVERLAFMVHDADLRLVVAVPGQEEVAAKLGTKVVAFPSKDSCEPNPAPALSPECLAYVIYTSGSTGKPKGVQVAHRNVIRLFGSTRVWFHFCERDTWSLFHSYAFDFSVWEIWGALLHGGRVVVVPFATSRSPLDYYKLISEEKITILNQTPSAFRHLTAAEEVLPGPLPLSLRLVIFGGEALEMKSLERWFDRHGDENPRLVNMYGITETTVHVTYRPLCKDDVSRGSVIGRPLPDLQLHILDQNLDPTPVGVPGEIYVGGAGLARGYLNRPDLTSERFIPDPFSDDPKARLYRSGDAARRLLDGDIEYLGRLDNQVQLRGFRIELCEIEFALGKHLGVESSVVITDKDGAGEPRLWAYFVPRVAICPTGAELRAFLAMCLPDYMIPAGFTRMDAWPMNENGKLDRRALPRPGASSLSERRPRAVSATEARLLACCREILGDAGFGVDDPLLEAGFHSLAFAHLAWRIQKEFEIVPTFSEMFVRRTVAELALLVEAWGEDGGPNLEPLTPVDRGQQPPPSFSQERVWFLEKLHPDNNAYYFQSILRFHGQLDVPALERALNFLVRRHEILRTAFPQSKGRPFQRIHPFAPFSLPVEAVTPSQAEQRVAQVVRKPFDLERLPPVRWILFRLGAEEHWLLHREHHLLQDGWEYGIFLEELFACYDAFSGGRDPALPPLPVQFADFAVWQRQQLASGQWDAQLDYWQTRLHGPSPVLQLPTDRPRPASQTFAGAQIRLPLDGAFHSQLLAACAREGVTPYMWLLAAFQAFLFRYTGQTDIVVGSGFANRRSVQAQKLLGMVINTVAMRMDFSEHRSFRDVLASCRRSVMEAADNQDAPFDRVIQRLGPGTVLFNTFIDIYDQPYPSYQNDVLHVTRHDVINNGSCKFDIVVLVIPSDEAPALLLWEYNSDLFSEEAASRMLRHFLALVAASIDNPELPVAALPMLSFEDRERLLLVGRGPNSQSALADRRIEEIFAEIAAAQADAPAVIHQEKQLSYEELNQRAEEIAMRLRAEGARPGGLVAFALPRGPQTIAVMLAILKCGCAYLPLDAKLPKARVNVLLGVARPSMLLTAEMSIRSESLASLAEPVPPDAAYIMFTSGSTGAPKAVCAPHRAVIRLVGGVDYVRLDAQTRFLQLAPLAFDASTLEIWGPLLNGGTVVVHPQDLPAFSELGRTLASHRVTTAWLTASLFNQIITTAPKILRPLQELITGGEALSVPHVLRALAELPETKLLNGYGPTETTTFASTFTIPRDFDPAARRVPIGRPLPNTQVYVLNELGHPQPIGVPGELFIGGDGLALGYRGDEDLTATRFVSDRFSGRPGARLYRTGDRVRWLPDGTLDFLERCDRQVKIHGFRIEPGEIESVLARHPAVREVFVTAPEEAVGDRRLIAYVVLQPSRTTGELRSFLQARLPDYMVPAQFVVLDTLPKTPSGKLDPRQLPLPGHLDRENSPQDMAARTALEEVLLGVWANVLKRDRVGVHDDFFLSGGDSLLALQLIHELNAAFELELPVRLLFDEPTAAGQARVIERALASRRSPSPERHLTYAPLVPLRPGGNKPPFFLVAGGFGGEAELLVYAKLARYLDTQQPFYGLRARGVDELVEPHPTVELMAAEHVREIRTIQPRGPYFIGGACVGGVVALEIAQQLRAQGEPIGLLIVLDSQFPSWQSLLRNRMRHLWREQVMPFFRRCRASRREFRAALRERILLLFAPSREQKIGRRKVCIGRKYVRRILRYNPRPYRGPVTLILCQEQNRPEPERAWHDLAGDDLEVLYVAGDHSTHLREHVHATAARIGACLEAAQARKLAA